MNQSKKILAALVAIPASVVVAGEVQAAEETKVETIEIKNSMIGNATHSNKSSIQSFTIDDKAKLEAVILTEMSKFTEGFTVTYTGTDMANYKKTIEDLMSSLRSKLNTNQTVTVSSDTVDVNITELYGTFNNMRVKATETTDGSLTSVKLEFSVNYFGPKKELTDAKAKYSTIGINTSSSDVAKIKEVHDYIIENTYHNQQNHRLNSNGSSSHAYALWAYTLLQQAIDPNKVRYVYGNVNGEYRSWNIVQIGIEWYHLDLFANDVTGSQTINYRRFLTHTLNERNILSGAGGNTPSDTKYNYFKTIDNLAQSADYIYYAAAESNGEIKRLKLSDLTPESLNISLADASTGAGRMVYYEQTSSDTVSIVGEYLYFINDSQGKYLYRYDLGNDKLELLLKEQLQSIELAAPILDYVKTDGKTGFIPLNNLVDLDKEYAQTVIAEIDRLDAIVDKTTKAYKDGVAKARQMYVALTAAQKEYVGADNYAKLVAMETAIGGGALVKPVVDLINALDIMNTDYIDKVNAAKRAYDAYSSPNKATEVYNYAILAAALALINEAQTLKTSLDAKKPEDGDLFEVEDEAITFIEGLLKKYDSYLPSIRKAIGFNETTIEELRNTAAALRTEAQSFINQIKILDANQADFLTRMDTLIAQQEDLLKSQKYLIRNDSTIVTQKITLANTMKQQIDTFNGYMAAISSEDVTTIKLTAALQADMKEAQKLYKEMKPSQIAETNPADVEKLNAIIDRINRLANNPKIKELNAQITALSSTKMASLADIKAQLATIDAAILEIQGAGYETTADVIELLNIEQSQLGLYNTLAATIDAAIKLQVDMGSLTNETTSDTIKVIRNQYESLITELKKFFTEQLKVLEAQEARLVAGNNQAAANKIVEKINALSESSKYADVLAVHTEFTALSEAIKALVTDEAKAKIEDLLKKAQSSKAAIEEVNKMIAALNEKSTREDIKKVEEAHAALADTAKAEVIGYDKIATLLAALEQAEADVIAKAEADRVVALMRNLTDESSETEILAARAAYEALTEDAKDLIPAKELNTLVYYENRLAKLKEEAQAEAQVVIDRINRITNSYTEAQIKSVRMAYNELSVIAKTLVTNLQKLLDAEAYILYQNTVVKEAKLSAAAFDEYMAKINRNSTTAEIAKARSLYNSLSAEAKKHVATYEKLVRLETMWQDPEYLELVYTYYPDYINAIKPGGIVIQKPTYDPLDIPDDSLSAPNNDFASVIPNSATWSPFETMTYQNGRHMTKLTSTQVATVTDRTMILKADNIEIVVPTVDLQAASGTVGVSIAVANNQLDIQFTKGNSPMIFSGTVEIIVPMSVLKGNAKQMIERINVAGNTVASFKVDGSNFIIRTKTSGTFKASTVTTNYTDLSTNAQSQAIRALAQHGITYKTTGRMAQLNKQVNRADIATFITTALDLSSKKKPKYQDLDDAISAERAQGLLEAGIMSGMTSSSFSPTATVSKQEAAIIIANMYRYLNQDLSRAYNELKSSYRDVESLPLEARQSIAILELFGVENGQGAFNPNEKLTRGQFAEMFYKALQAIDYL